MIDAISKITIFVIYWLQTAPDRISDWVKIKIFHSHKKIVTHGQILHDSPDKLAIFAIYPGTTTLASNLRIIESLLKNNFKVLVVLNDNQYSADWVKEILKTDCMIITRPNLGRDFGAYQAGFNYLLKKKLLISSTKLVFVNDTSYVTPKSQLNFLTDFFGQDTYNCLMKHYQGYVHAASNLLVFGQEVFLSKSFIRFWKSYYPSNMRFHAVFRGEHKLSKIVGHSYFTPATGLIRKHAKKFIASEYLQLTLWAQRSYPDYASAIDSLRTSTNFNWEREATYMALDNFQVSNSLGLYLSRVYFFPLKLDLAYYLLCSREDIYQILEHGGCDADEVDIIKKKLELRGSATLGNPYKRLLRRYGLLT
jgi:hypothetical protein